MEITVGGEAIKYSLKTQTDKNNVTRQYYRASIIVGTAPGTGKHIKKVITAPTKERLREKILSIQHARPLDNGSILTFQQYISAWIKNNKYRFKPTTYAKLCYMCNHYAFPAIGSVIMADINEAIFYDFFQTVIKKHSLPTAHNIKAVLTFPMKEACEKQLTYGNPLAYIHLPKYQSAKIIPLTKKEAQELIDLCRENPFGAPIALTLQLGLRISEVIGLSLDDIDLKHRLIHIRRQINQVESNYVLQNCTKNNVERILYLDDLTVEFIEQELKRQEQNRLHAGNLWNNEYNCLFTDSTGNFIKHQTLRKNFKVLAIQIGRPDIKFHHLRHTAATIIHEELGDISAAKALLGHKRYDSTGNYIHTSAERMKRAAIAISNYTTIPYHTTAEKNPGLQSIV